MPEADETARVTMLWPAELKERVREKVGARGLTPFAVAAVEKHFDYVYGKHESGDQPTGQVEPPMAATAPLPETPAPEPDAEPVVTTPVSGDPAEVKSQMRTCDPGCGETYDVFVDGEFEKHIAHKHAAKREVEVAAEKEAEPTPQDLPHDTQAPKTPNLLEKLKTEGAAMGIDMDLKPASEVLKPYPKEEAPTSPAATIPADAPDGTKACEFHPEMVVSPGKECYKCTLEKNGTDTTPKPAPTPEPAVPMATEQTCITCGSVLVDGECWECM